MSRSDCNNDMKLYMTLQDAEVGWFYSVSTLGLFNAKVSLFLQVIIRLLVTIPIK